MQRRSTTPASVRLRSYNPVREVEPGRSTQAVELLPSRAAGSLRRRRRGQCRATRPAASCAELVRATGFPFTPTLMGLGAYPAQRPEVPRHARHARHLRSQHGDARLRPHARDRRPLRRPRHRRARRASPSSARSTSTSTRRSINKNVHGRRADRRRRAAHARSMLAWKALEQLRPARAGWWAQIAEWQRRTACASARPATVIKPQHAIQRSTS